MKITAMLLIRKPLINPVEAKVVYWLCWLLLPWILLNGANAQTEQTTALEQAIELRKQGQVYDSIELLQGLKSVDDSNVRVNLELAISYLKAKQYCRAEEAVEYIFTLAPLMKDNEKLNKLKTMISHSQQKANSAQHLFKAEVTAYKGFEELTSEFTYLELTEFEDYYQVERKNETVSSKYYYSGARFKGEYRYTPTESFNLFGQPTYSFWSNRLTYFYKESDTLEKVRFGFTSLDSSLFVIQPKNWAINARLKGKWHTYQGQKTLTEQSLDINGSMLFYGARVKLGISHNDNVLDMGFINSEFNDSGHIFEEKTSLVSPYLRISYRFSPALLLTLGTKVRNIHADNELLEGKIRNYSSTLKYDVSDTFEVHLSYYHNDLRYSIYDLEDCFDLESFSCLNSGELKRTFTFGGGYNINPHWQVGINALYVDKKQDNDFGQDQWKRLEGFVRYRF